MMKKKLGWVVAGLVGFVPFLASAHENYVLPKGDIDRGMMDWSVNVWQALSKPENIFVAMKFGAGLIAAYVLYFFFARSKWGARFDAWLRKGEDTASAVVRIVLGISLLYSAHLQVFLGPEIPLSSIPGGASLRMLLYIFGIMMVLGVGARVAGAGAMAVILLATITYHDYMVTYFNYFGEFFALAAFGAYSLSLDMLRTTGRVVARKVRQWEALILRVTYGISVLYPAITIKLLHPIIMIEIVQRYHLDDIHWLFPTDPLLISLGTGLVQIIVGLAIIIGFETRLNSLMTFTLYIMSILYFKEAVWPHYILLALAGYLFINNGGDWTLDAWLAKRHIQK